MKPVQRSFVPDPPRHVRVVEQAGQLAVVAASLLPAGSLIIELEGQSVPRGSRYSVQIGVAEHLDLLGPLDDGEAADHHPWRFLNHACDPSSWLDGRRLLARRDHVAGDQVTFDYEANEWQMAEPFLCACGAAHCRGLIRGYRFLDGARRARIASYTARHLRALEQQIGLRP